MNFIGYPRTNGLGVRNYVAVMSSVGCSADVARKITRLSPCAKAIVHHQGCAQIPPDIGCVEKILANLGLNPNIHSVLLVSLGCESVSVEKVADAIAKEKHVETVVVQDIGMSKAISRGTELVSKMASTAENARKEEVDLSEVKLAIKCGASDTTSGIVSNPVAGGVADRIVEAGGTVIFGETTELIGAEHILARRAENKKIVEQMYKAVEEMEGRVLATGVDMRGGQPTGGNIKGGITTIEEKSLGAVSKTGSSTLGGVVDYGEIVKEKGLVFMDGPGREPEALMGFAAGGAQIMLFSTGRGAPQGFPVVPVVKISGNPETCQKLSEHMDVDLSPVFFGQESVDKACERVLEEIVRVASGKLTKAENLGYDEISDIYVRGPVI